MNKSISSPASNSDKEQLSPLESMKAGFRKRCKEDAVSALLFYIANCDSPSPVQEVLESVSVALGVSLADLAGDSLVSLINNK